MPKGIDYVVDWIHLRFSSYSQCPIRGSCRPGKACWRRPPQFYSSTKVLKVLVTVVIDLKKISYFGLHLLEIENLNKKGYTTQNQRKMWRRFTWFPLVLRVAFTIYFSNINIFLCCHTKIYEKNKLFFYFKPKQLNINVLRAWIWSA